MAKLTRWERFKDARTVHNQHGKQTMDEVAIATGVSKSMIQSLEDEKADRSVGYDKVAKLASHYHVSADYLLGLSDDPSPRGSAVDDLGLSYSNICDLRLWAQADNDGLDDCCRTKFINAVISAMSAYHFSDSYAEILELSCYEDHGLSISSDIAACEFMMKMRNSGQVMLSRDDALKYYARDISDRFYAFLTTEYFPMVNENSIDNGQKGKNNGNDQTD